MQENRNQSTGEFSTPPKSDEMPTNKAGIRQPAINYDRPHDNGKAPGPDYVLAVVINVVVNIHNKKTWIPDYSKRKIYSSYTRTRSLEHIQINNALTKSASAARSRITIKFFYTAVRSGQSQSTQQINDWRCIE